MLRWEGNCRKKFFRIISIKLVAKEKVRRKNGRVPGLGNFMRLGLERSVMHISTIIITSITIIITNHHHDHQKWAGVGNFMRLGHERSVMLRLLLPEL